MIYINHNRAIEHLQDLINNRYSKTRNYLPDDFNKQQNNALKVLKNRVFLEETIEECIGFNKKLIWEETNKNLQLLSSVEDLIEILALRSNVYSNLGYQNEFPDLIDGLNFDKYDKTSAILLYKSNSKITGTTRLIFDSPNKLPTESKTSFSALRNRYKTIGELSRLIVDKDNKGLNLEFKYLMQGIYTLFMNNKIDITILSIIEKHYKLYTKFGGSEIIKILEDFGEIGHSVYVLTWNPAEASKFFKKAFLS